ncbi:MAG: hypothetical protein NC394_06830 [Bacteroides sp.]|nr:hypothetical protein [Bacteroides sp.]
MSARSYDFYLDKCLLPVTPSRLEISEKGLNRVISLIDGGEINLLKRAGLKEIRFDCIIPQVSYPFSSVERVKPAEYYLDFLEGLRDKKRPFQFIVSRVMPSGKILFSTDIKVSLEDLAVTEAAEQGFDLVLSIKLRQYRDYGLKSIGTFGSDGTAAETNERSASTTAEKPITIGCDVIINGRLYGNSYGEAAGQTRTDYRGKINFINLDGSHAYHVTTPSGQWLGWVTRNSIRVI